MDLRPNIFTEIFEITPVTKGASIMDAVLRRVLSNVRNLLANKIVARLENGDPLSTSKFGHCRKCMPLPTKVLNCRIGQNDRDDSVLIQVAVWMKTPDNGLKQEARSKKQEARSKKQEARSKKQEARSEKQGR